jgi:hypothetical protein
LDGSAVLAADCQDGSVGLEAGWWVDSAGLQEVSSDAGGVVEIAFWYCLGLRYQVPYFSVNSKLQWDLPGLVQCEYALKRE